MNLRSMTLRTWKSSSTTTCTSKHQCIPHKTWFQTNPGYTDTRSAMLPVPWTTHSFTAMVKIQYGGSTAQMNTKNSWSLQQFVLTAKRDILPAIDTVANPRKCLRGEAQLRSNWQTTKFQAVTTKEYYSNLEKHQPHSQSKEDGTW